MSEGTNPGIPSSPEENDATQFQPSAPAPVSPPAEAEERTRFIAPDEMAQAAASAPPPPQATAVPDPLATTNAPRMTQNPFSVPAPATARKIEIGDVLNHTYEVRRFIARGGMGEVYEGVNVNAEDDRVAIKVMLPHLAADPLVQAMFSKEAKTLTRLRHPGLVQYRLLGREPVLGVTYIVTEFVDGVNLSDVLKTLEATPDDQITLLKRLASALGAAHELDAVHRDISPDNVLLDGGQLKNAKIIDFGIAKDLDAGAKTIVGDGFAGKLGYVAPEQLGSYGRSVGGWSDIYSLALVMLAVAQKKDVDMGGSLADAFDKRKEVPDLSAAPEKLRPILTKMLQPDPANRLRTMDAVLAEVAALEGGGTALEQATRLQFEANAGGGGAGRPPAPPASSKGLLIGGGAAALLALAAGGYLMFGGGGGDGARDPDAERAARSAVLAGLPSIECSWLDIASIGSKGSTIDIGLRGVAGAPDGAKAKIDGLLSAAGLTAGTVNFDDVKSIDTSDCGAVEAFRTIRDYDGNRLMVTQRQYEMKKLGASFGADAGKLAAAPVVQVDLNQLDGDVAVFGLEETGEIGEIITDRTQLEPGDAIKQVKPNVFSFELITDHKGWSGVLLLKGQGPFDPKLVAKPAGPVSDDWKEKFLQAAEDNGWKSEMVWYRTVDEKPG